MSEMTCRDAVIRALTEEMERDESVILLGEDVAAAGGVFKATAGLLERFGPDRVRDTPISEAAIIGAGIGAALTGMRPVVELMFADFAAVALDQIVNEAAKLRYMSGGRLKVPMVIRAAQGAGGGFAAQHSQCVETLFMHYAGLKVAAPGTPADVLGLLKTAIRDDNPVIFLEHKMLYNLKGDVPDGEHLVPFGKARIAREGRDVTIVASQKMLGPASEAAERLDAEGISCEIIDPRTFAPLDFETIGRSLEKTGRLVTVEEAVRPCGWGAEIVSRLCEEGFWWLDAPVRRVTMGESIIPFSQSLEDALMPGVDEMIAAVHALA